MNPSIGATTPKVTNMKKLPNKPNIKREIYGSSTTISPWTLVVEDTAVINVPDKERMSDSNV